MYNFRSNSFLIFVILLFIIELSNVESAIDNVADVIKSQREIALLVRRFNIDGNSQRDKLNLYEYLMF